MISFGQILILIFLGLLLFGDSLYIFNKVVLFFVNLKTLVKKLFSSKGKNSSSDNR